MRNRAQQFCVNARAVALATFAMILASLLVPQIASANVFGTKTKYPVFPNFLLAIGVVVLVLGLFFLLPRLNQATAERFDLDFEAGMRRFEARERENQDRVNAGLAPLPALPNFTGTDYAPAEAADRRAWRRSLFVYSVGLIVSAMAVGAILTYELVFA